MSLFCPTLSPQLSFFKWCEMFVPGKLLQSEVSVSVELWLKVNFSSISLMAEFLKTRKQTNQIQSVNQEWCLRHFVKCSFKLYAAAPVVLAPPDPLLRCSQFLSSSYAVAHQRSSELHSGVQAPLIDERFHSMLSLSLAFKMFAHNTTAQTEQSSSLSLGRKMSFPRESSVIKVIHLFRETFLSYT